MHPRIAFCMLLSAGLAAACGSANAPPPHEQARRPDEAQAQAATVLDTQLEALERSRQVQNVADRHAAALRRATSETAPEQ